MLSHGLERRACHSSSSPQEEANYLSLLSVLGRRRLLLMTLTTHAGSLCPVLMTKGLFSARRNTWHIEKHGMRSLCCLFLLRLHPRLCWALTRQRQNPSLCSPPPAVALPAMPEQSIQLCSSPPAPSSRGKAGQLGQEYPPTAGKPRCSPVPHKFVRPLGMEFMRGDSSKEKVPEITA